MTKAELRRECRLECLQLESGMHHAQISNAIDVGQ